MTNALVFGAVVAARLLLPLLIFRFPLPAIIGCLVLDGYDQTIFQQFTTLDLEGYQSYDKALDIYYLSIAYLSMMRNWTNPKAFAVSQFLYYYRLVGVTIFESAGGDERWLLMIFPNTFEYFFIFYEAVRLLWNPARLGLKFWLWAAALIWVFIKLPQEYWLHIAQLDLSDTLRDYPWVWGVIIGGVALIVAVFWFVVWPRCDPPDHALALTADPLPPEIGSAAVVREARLDLPRVITRWVVEQVVMLSLICTIFASILPGIDVSFLSTAVAVTLLVVVNSAVGLWTARRGITFSSIGSAFLALAVFNAALVWLTETLRPGTGEFPAGQALFFVLLLTLVVVLYDRYRPVHEARLAAQVEANAGP